MAIAEAVNAEPLRSSDRRLSVSTWGSLDFTVDAQLGEQERAVVDSASRGVLHQETSSGVTGRSRDALFIRSCRRTSPRPAIGFRLDEGVAAGCHHER